MSQATPSPTPTVTITLLIKRGNSEGLRFLNGTWQLLLQNESLKTGFAFLTIEYDDVRTLSDGLDKKVKRCPYIDFRSGSKTEAYPQGRLLQVPHIVAFALEFQKQAAEHVETPSSATRDVPVDVAPPSSWRYPLMVIGGASAIVVTVFTIVLLWDYRKRGKTDKISPDDPVFLVTGRTGEDLPVDFSQIKFGKHQDSDL
jgi:hypothetical protein